MIKLLFSLVLLICEIMSQTTNQTSGSNILPQPASGSQKILEPITEPISEPTSISQPKILSSGAKKQLNQECIWQLIGSQCDSGMTCDVNIHKCRKRPGQKCSHSEECLAGHHCDLYPANPMCRPEF
jgi:hypothetical protein